MKSPKNINEVQQIRGHLASCHAQTTMPSFFRFEEEREIWVDSQVRIGFLQGEGLHLIALILTRLREESPLLLYLLVKCQAMCLVLL